MTLREAARDTAPQDVHAEMLAIGRRARAAMRQMTLASTTAKNMALTEAAAAIRRGQQAILADNALDVAGMQREGGSASFIDRLKLTPARIEAIAKGIEEIAALPDPVGIVMSEWDRPNGLHIERVRTPLGVVGIIYESRPNVTADAGALCLKAGNAAILRGGSDSFRSSGAIHRCLVEGLRKAKLPEDAIQMVPTRDRAAVGEMLTGLEGTIDVIVPRGGKSLVKRVQNEARVPVFAHLEGICHTYIHAAADLDMAVKVTVNAKMRRTSICGATETLLVDKAVVGTHLKPVVEALQKAGCEIRGDEITRATVKGVVPAAANDYGCEFLEAIIAVKVVDGLDAAIDWIDRYGSHHTDSIITKDTAAAEKFLREVDSAIVLHNASTQFADGGEFGMGAEIGIATGRMHARGPVGVEQLTSFKYRVRGSGQTRP